MADLFLYSEKQVEILSSQLINKGLAGMNVLSEQLIEISQASLISIRYTGFAVSNIPHEKLMCT